jgi:ABC-type uncharacterized transport system permease subunit
MPLNLTLYTTATLYALGTILVLIGLYGKSARLQHMAMAVMTTGFLAHTVWIGMMCSTTKQPPLGNLPEIASFVAWCVFAVELILFIRYRVHAAAFFVYPLILMLIMITVAVQTPFVPPNPALDSKLFVAHLLLTSTGIAALLIGVAFYMLYQYQERALKSKRQGPLFDWIPSLLVCETVSYRSLAIGFSIYTLGLLAGFLWSYRTTAEVASLGSKEIGAVVAWVFFAALIQSHVSGSYRTQKTLLLSVAAFISILVAIFGIQHV